MSNYSEILDLVQQFTGQKSVITICKPFVTAFGGDLVTALVFGQLLFWSDKGKRRDNYVYKSYQEWTDETTLSARQVKRAADKLVSLDLVEIDLKLANGAPTLHYRIKPESVENWIKRNVLNDESAKSITRKPRNLITRKPRNPDNAQSAKSLTVNTQPLPDMTTDTLAQPSEIAKPTSAELREESKRLAEERKASIAATMARGQRTHAVLTGALNRLFEMNYNFESKTGKDFVLWLKERPTTETVDDFAKWWFTTDWRGKTGQPPTMNQIKELWPQAFKAEQQTTDRRTGALDL